MNDTRVPVAFIGLGLMGAHMAGQILAAGHPLHVYNRTRAKAEGLVAWGAIWHDDPGSTAAAADVVITTVGVPQDVEAVGAQGIIAQARPGAILIDMTTSSPSLAKRIAAATKARGLGAIDAPVSGGDVGARDAKLSIMIGGEKANVAAVMPILQLTRMVGRDFAAGFFVEHLIKDLRIAAGEAGAAGLELKGLITALGQYTLLAERGGLRDGTQALIKVYD